MGGECFLILIPAIAVVLLIVGGIMRGVAQAQEEEKQRQLRKRQRTAPRPEGAPARPPAGSGNELDRFLQEVQRRKRGEQAPAEPVPVAKPVPPRPRERPPAPRRPRTEQPAPRSRSGRRAEVVAVAEEVLPVVEVVEERPAPIWEPRTAGPMDAILPIDPQTAEQAYRTATPATRPPIVVQPAVVQLGELVRSQQSLRAAMMLGEILGPPRCPARREKRRTGQAGPSPPQRNTTWC